MTSTYALTGDDLTTDDVWAVAVEGHAATVLSDAAREQMRAARRDVERVAHGAHEHTYGVNTGFGRFVSKQIPEELTEELQLRLLRSHACGVGDVYPAAVVRAAMDDHPLTCTSETELDEIRRMMLERHARYMPVMDRRMLMGVISFYDVAKAVVDSQNFENRMLKAYIRDWPVESRDELPSSNPN